MSEHSQQTCSPLVAALGIICGDNPTTLSGVPGTRSTLFWVKISCFSLPSAPIICLSTSRERVPSGSRASRMLRIMSAVSTTCLNILSSDFHEVSLPVLLDSRSGMPVSKYELPLDSPPKPPCSASYSEALSPCKSRRAAIVEPSVYDYLAICLNREMSTCRT